MTQARASPHLGGVNGTPQEATSGIPAGAALIASSLRLRFERESAHLRPTAADGDGISAEPHRHHRYRYGPEMMEALVPLWEASESTRSAGKGVQTEETPDPVATPIGGNS